MKYYKNTVDNKKDQLQRKIDKSEFTTVKSNEQFMLFLSKLDEYFLTHNMMDLQVKMSEESYFATFDYNDIVEKLILSPSIRIFDRDICNVTFLPKKDGIELYRLEVYNPGKGIGSILMKAFIDISQQTGIKIFLIPGDPGFNNGHVDLAKRRNFYHKFGFKRTKTSDYWSN